MFNPNPLAPEDIIAANPTVSHQKRWAGCPLREAMRKVAKLWKSPACSTVLSKVYQTAFLLECHWMSLTLTYLTDCCLSVWVGVHFLPIERIYTCENVLIQPEKIDASLEQPSSIIWSPTSLLLVLRTSFKVFNTLFLKISRWICWLNGTCNYNKLKQQWLNYLGQIKICVWAWRRNYLHLLQGRAKKCHTKIWHLLLYHTIKLKSTFSLYQYT